MNVFVIVVQRVCPTPKCLETASESPTARNPLESSLLFHPTTWKHADPHSDHSQLGDISDTQSETGWRNQRKTLPSVPAGQQPVSMATVRLQAQRAQQRLAGRASSSLDFQLRHGQPAPLGSASAAAVGQSSLTPTSSKQPATRSQTQSGPLSPFSSLSDIAHLINQSSAVTLGRLSPALVAHAKPGRSTTR